jgi:uncharacterized protein (DUF1015 family)
MDFRPFRPLCPNPSIASRLISPPYDVMSTSEARVLGADELSFLRVTRSELELSDSQDAYGPEVYALARKNLDRLIASEALVPRGRSGWAVYRQTRGAHAQLGLVGLASVREYEQGLVKKHELTRAEKEDDRTRHIDVTEAQTGPVFLAMRASSDMKDLLVEASLGKPDLDAWMANGVRHEAWFIDEGTANGERLAKLLAETPASYIADGHHRAASAMRVARLRREQGHTEGPWEHFLAVVFPSDWLKILPYNRVVSDLNGHSEAGFLAALDAHFEVGPAGALPTPSARHVVSMYLGGTWRELRMKGVDESDAIASLDVAFLQDKLLHPLLGIADPRRDHRIDFVGGIRGTRTLEERVGAGGVAFSMYPTSLDELFRVADQDAIMPPKSTWFEPKLADGLFVHDIARSPR